MQLSEIREEIRNSTAEYWNHIPDGPLFNYNLGNSGHEAKVFGYHSARAVLLHDVDIALEFGMSDDPSGHEEWEADWAPFRDKRIRGFYCDVFYRGALVDRELLAYVDGHRAVLPVPEEAADGEGWEVGEWPYQLARLVDDLSGRRRFEEYFRRSGVVALPE